MKHLLLLLSVFVQVAAFSQPVVRLTTGKNTSSIPLPAKLVYAHPTGERGWYLRGLNTEHDGTYDIRRYYGLRLSVRSDKDKLLNIRCCLKRAPTNDRHNLADSTSVVVQTSGNGWRDLLIPFSAFDYNRGQEYFLKFIKDIVLSIEYADHSVGTIGLKDIRIVKAHTLAMETDVYSRPLSETYETDYRIRVTNTSAFAQTVALQIRKDGWEGMEGKVEPTSLFLNPEESAWVTVKVSGSDFLPAGAHESTVLQATPLMNNGKTEEIELISVVPVHSPFIVHDSVGWAEVKQKAEKYDWVHRELQEFIRTAEMFEVPEVKKGTISDQGTEGLVRAYIETPLYQTAIAYYLTRNQKYGEKVAETLRRLTDPVMGYPRTQHLTFQGIPQEGGTMEGLLLAYDLLKESGLLSEKDCTNIENTFRLFCRNIIDMMGDGGISNWSVFNLAPAAKCALLLHDMHLFNQLAYGPCGLIDHLRYGTMDDGWWYEMSLSYNLGCAMCYTTTALAARTFGIDWINRQFPASLTRKVGLRPFEFENLYGMAFGKFGPLKQNTINIKRMWDGILPYPDYRGVMFGMGDGHEQILSGEPFELAYYVFRDSRYASVLKRMEKRSLVYGVPVFPEETSQIAGQSAYSDNAGIAVLRSQTPNRPQSEQIQVALKYGTHGSYHGHFDRISLLSMMRYGRSFYNPETSWFGYGSYMYKWWVQPSMSHNMVVVDGKMQEPTSCDQFLFYSGKMMQVHAMSTDARWSNSPYLGGYDQIEDIRRGNLPYVPIEQKHPAPGDIGKYSEPVHQRRLTIVTDDYVVLADYLKGNEQHLFENLFHLRGAHSESGLRLVSHTPQWNDDSLNSGQFITNVSLYKYQQGGKITSVHHFAPKGKDGKNIAINNWETGGQNRFYNEPGDLNVDVYMAWPQQATVKIGDYAEDWGLSKKMDYQVKADGELLEQGSIGIWILGKHQFNVPLKGKNELSLIIKANRRDGQRKTFVLADAYLVTSKGKKIALSSLKPLTENVMDLPAKGKDYEGGPVKIAGSLYKEAIGIEPLDVQKEAHLSYDLKGLDVVCLEGIIGGDYPVGNEEQLRKSIGVCQRGNEAVYLTIIELHEGNPVIKKVKAEDPSRIEVTLKDGRVQYIELQGFYSSESKDVHVSISEQKDGKLIRTETTDSLK